MRKPRRRELQRARRNEPRQELNLEHSRLDGRILLDEHSRLLQIGLEQAEPPHLAPRIEQRPCGEQLSRLVQLGKEVQVLVLNRAGSLLVELRRSGRGQQQDGGEAVEVHLAMLDA
jgi:hypothetical protein